MATGIEVQGDQPLKAWESATIEVFTRASNLIGLPRSVGEIYGLLFCAEAPLTFDDLQFRLGISRGSVSQGLKVLRQLGAVKVQYVSGSRKDHYIPELSMKRLVSGFVRDQFMPHLESGDYRLKEIGEHIDAEENPELCAHALERLRILRSWQSRTRKLVPVAMAVLGGTEFFSRQQDEPTEII